MDESKENRKIETKELVRQYLKRKYPHAQFSDIDLNFLVRYSVKKEPSANTILKSIGNDIQTEQAYYNAHPAVKAVKTIFNTYTGVLAKNRRIIKTHLTEVLKHFWLGGAKEKGNATIAELMRIH